MEKNKHHAEPNKDLHGLEEILIDKSSVGQLWEIERFCVGHEPKVACIRFCMNFLTVNVKTRRPSAGFWNKNLINSVFWLKSYVCYKLGFAYSCGQFYTTNYNLFVSIEICIQGRESVGTRKAVLSEESCYMYHDSRMIHVRRVPSTVWYSRVRAWRSPMKCIPVRLRVVHKSYEGCRMHRGSIVGMISDHEGMHM
jgi:hypothetical protein